MKEETFRGARFTLAIGAGVITTVYFSLTVVAMVDGADRGIEIPPALMGTMLAVIAVMTLMAGGMWAVETSNRISREKLLEAIREQLRGADGDSTVRLARLDPTCRAEIIDDVRNTFRDEIEGPVRDIATRAVSHALIARATASVPVHTNGAPVLKIAREE